MVDKKKITEKVIKLGETGKSVWESLNNPAGSWG